MEKMSNYNSQRIRAIKSALSPARMSTFENAINHFNNDYYAPIELYLWNASISGAMLARLHICEIVVRNAISDALEAKYGTKWPWSASFEKSLIDPNHGYSARKDLLNARRCAHATEKVIPELTFVFWQSMFTARYDLRIWNNYLHQVLPNLNHEIPVKDNRLELYNKLHQIRKLRNRIAHHEPVFSRNLADDYHKIITIIRYRCNHTALWLHQNQCVIMALDKKPKTIR